MKSDIHLNGRRLMFLTRRLRQHRVCSQAPPKASLGVVGWPRTAPVQIRRDGVAGMPKWAPSLLISWGTQPRRGRRCDTPPTADACRDQQAQAAASHSRSPGRSGRLSSKAATIVSSISGTATTGAGQKSAKAARLPVRGHQRLRGQGASAGFPWRGAGDQGSRSDQRRRYQRPRPSTLYGWNR